MDRNHAIKNPRKLVEIQLKNMGIKINTIKQPKSLTSKV